MGVTDQAPEVTHILEAACELVTSSMSASDVWQWLAQRTNAPPLCGSSDHQSLEHAKPGPPPTDRMGTLSARTRRRRSTASSLMRRVKSAFLVLWTAHDQA